MKALKIIIAEDHELFRKTIIKELESFNIVTIGEAVNGIGLLEELKTKKPDVVLLDLEMPGMDGNKAYTVMRDKYPEVKIIILSQHDEKGLMENYLERGVNAYLPKQLISSDLGILAEAIRAVEDSGYFITEEKTLSKKFKYTEREVEIIPLLCEGKTNKEIAAELGLGEKTIEKHRAKIYLKTNARNAAQFLKYSFKKGLDFLGKK